MTEQTYCEWDCLSSGCPCVRCGYTLRRDYEKPPIWSCNHSPRSEKPGAGDKLESALAALGITPERYVAVKELFGLPPTCGCAKRKAWLNSVSDWWRGENATDAV
jgi:hypothetical protein